jgi:hypothetical protein
VSVSSNERPLGRIRFDASNDRVDWHRSVAIGIDLRGVPNVAVNDPKSTGGSGIYQ